jgi:putative endonuclease
MLVTTAERCEQRHAAMFGAAIPRLWCRFPSRDVLPSAMRRRDTPVPVAQWTDPRQRRGLWGERVAMAHLVQRGWIIESHRFRLGHRELDVVARKGRLVAIVEVKTRASDAYGQPAESVLWRKRRTIAQVAEVWRERHGRVGDEFRFDVIEVRLEGGRPRVTHLADAWRVDE